MSIRSDILDKVHSTEGFPKSVTALLNLLFTDDVTVSLLADAIKDDEAIVKTVINTVNAMNYDTFDESDEAQTLDQAVARMGENLLVNIVMSSCAPHIYHQALTGYESTEGEFWENSLFTAIAAREIAEHLKDEINQNIAFMAGLLHGIGKVVITDFIHGHVPELMKSLDDKSGEEFLKLEKEHLGTDHSEVGYELGVHLGLGDSLLDVIRYSRTPSLAKESNKQLVYCVHLGCILAMMSGYGTGADTMQTFLDPDYEDYVDVSNEQLESLLFRVQQEFQKISQLLLGQTVS